MPRCASISEARKEPKLNERPDSEGSRRGGGDVSSCGHRAAVRARVVARRAGRSIRGSSRRRAFARRARSSRRPTRCPRSSAGCTQHRRGGLQALRPQDRSDRGRGRHLSDELRQLICDIRREHPSASATFDRSHARGRRSLAARHDQARHRAQAAPATRPRSHRRTRRGRSQDAAALAGAVRPMRYGTPTFATDPRCSSVAHVHRCASTGMLDDCSRYRRRTRSARAASASKTCCDVIDARHSPPRQVVTCYFSTMARRTAVRSCSTACARLGISLVHAQTVRPRSTRQDRAILEHTSRGLPRSSRRRSSSLEDVNQRLATFVDRHYHRDPHAGLMGRAPLSVYEPSSRVPPNHVDEARCARHSRYGSDGACGAIPPFPCPATSMSCSKVFSPVASSTSSTRISTTRPRPKSSMRASAIALTLVDPVATPQRRRRAAATRTLESRTVVFDPSCTRRHR